MDRETRRAEEQRRDAALMERVARGDDDAFDELFEKHFPRLAMFCGMLLRDRARGEEMAQEAFLRIYRRRAHYEKLAAFTTYLYSVARRLCINELKRPERTVMCRFDDLTKGDDERDITEALEEEGATTLEHQREDRAALRRVLDALDELGEAQRTALILTRFHELSYEETAALMETSTKALKSLLNRARTSLVRILERDEVQGGL